MRVARFVAAVTCAALISGPMSLVGAEDFGPGGAPYPGDLGPAQVDVSNYPAEMQANYKIVARRCSQCHTLSRPLNSQFLQLSAAEQQTAKNKTPELFKDAKVWQISENIWTDYVKKMQSKPGAIIRGSEFDKIVAFLVYDSVTRKTGASKDSWKVARQKMLDDFKKADPKRYSELFPK